MRNIVVSQIRRNTTVPRIVMTDGSRDFPVPRRQELATSYVAVKPSKAHTRSIRMIPYAATAALVI